MSHDGSAPPDGLVKFGSFCLFLRERRLERDGLDVRIGSRALDILTALTERAGEVVSSEDLTARVWPDTAVEESSLRVHIARLRKALGDGQDGARYVTNVPGRGYCFVPQVSRSKSAARYARAPRVMDARTHDLPSRLERIVGREGAILEISAQLLGGRFVSLVGSGGMGKTTVAVAVAHALVPQLGGDVCFVDLSSVIDARQVPTAIASALGVAPQDDDATSRVVSLLEERRTLLVLDGCEHVIDVVAPLAERIFRGAAQVHILATSRESLRVEGEWVHRLLPLDCPPASKEVTAAEALTFPAVQLFVERAAASGARLVLRDIDAPVTAMICRRLDGIPLALELAAARVDAYGIQGIASLLETQFKLLWQGRRTAVPRHRTLSSMLHWSYDLLSDLERTVLRRTSIFVGSFPLDAVAVVVADGYGERATGALAALVEKSLVAVDRGGPHIRYRLLDTTRAYAQDQLDAANDRDVTARRHATYMCSVLDEESSVAESVTSLAEHAGNVRAALTWSFSDTGDTALGAALAAAWAPMFMDLPLLRDCHRRVELALANLDDAARGTRRELHLQAALGLSLMFTRGNAPEVPAALARGLSLADELGEPQQQFELLGALHLSMYRHGAFREALSLAERSEEIAERLLDPGARSLADWMIGTSSHLLGDQVEAARRCKTVLTPPPMSRRTAMAQFRFDHRTRALVILSRARWLAGYAEEAMRVATQILSEAATSGLPLTFASSFVWASTIFSWCGDLKAADDIVDRLLAYTAKHSLGAFHEAVGLGLKGELSVKRGAAAPGVELLRRSLKVLHAAHQEILFTIFATALAEGLGILGQYADALTTIDQAIGATARNHGSFDLPEMLRLKGHLLATTPVPDEAEAERYLLRALECARGQGAIAWELRAATTSARLLARQGRRAEARDVLTASYDKFTEGFETADLLAAKSLLSDL